MAHTTNRKATGTKQRPKSPSSASVAKATGHPRKSTSPIDTSKSWELYHLIGAFAIVVGVIAAAHNASELLQHLEHMSSIEESGFAAALIVCLRGVGSMLYSLVVAFGAFTSWLGRLNK